jgi:hypothetical protein
MREVPLPTFFCHRVKRGMEATEKSYCWKIIWLTETHCREDLLLIIELCIFKKLIHNSLCPLLLC